MVSSVVMASLCITRLRGEPTVAITTLFGRRPSSARKPLATKTRLHLECLEDRNLLAGLVAAYSFNEGSCTTVADASGNGNTGTISNAAWVQGNYGGGLRFTGALNSFVSIPRVPSLDLTNAMTLEAWVNPTSLN